MSYTIIHVLSKHSLTLQFNTSEYRICVAYIINVLGSCAVKAIADSITLLIFYPIPMYNKSICGPYSHFLVIPSLNSDA